jgi:hypothetical protein
MKAEQVETSVVTVEHSIAVAAAEAHANIVANDIISTPIILVDAFCLTI